MSGKFCHGCEKASALCEPQLTQVVETKTIVDNPTTTTVIASHQTETKLARMIYIRNCQKGCGSSTTSGFDKCISSLEFTALSS